MAHLDPLIVISFGVVFTLIGGGRIPLGIPDKQRRALLRFGPLIFLLGGVLLTASLAGY